jgi:hypothetical protein
LPFDTLSGVCGKLEGEGIVGASVQHHHGSWCHVEHLPSGPGVQPIMVQSDTDGPSETMRSTTSPLTCVSVMAWKDALREALRSPHVKIRISICTQPARGCVDSGEDGTEKLECSIGISCFSEEETRADSVPMLSCHGPYLG